MHILKNGQLHILFPQPMRGGPLVPVMDQWRSSCPWQGFPQMDKDFLFHYKEIPIKIVEPRFISAGKWYKSIRFLQIVTHKNLQLWEALFKKVSGGRGGGGGGGSNAAAPRAPGDGAGGVWAGQPAQPSFITHLIINNKYKRHLIILYVQLLLGNNESATNLLISQVAGNIYYIFLAKN